MELCYVNNYAVAVMPLLPEIPAIYCLIQMEAVFRKVYLPSY